MARKGVLTLWRILREVSVTQIRRDAEKRVSLGLVGTAEQIDALRRALLTDQPNTSEAAEGMASLRLFEVPNEADPSRALRGADAIITFSEHAALLDDLSIPVVFAGAGMPRVITQVLDACPDLMLAIPRRLPAFREEAARRLIAATSMINAELSLASALPGVIPAGWIALPASSMGDIVVLTKNQIFLLLKVAAVYGKPIHVRDRMRELLPVVGAAFGWRALARELVGAIPAGIGVVAKGTIAYAGTVAAGKAAALYYEGKLVNREDLNRLYLQAAETGRGLVESVASAKLGNRLALPQRSRDLPSRVEAETIPRPERPEER